MSLQIVQGEKLEQENRTGPKPTLRSLIDEFDKHNAHPAIINFTRTGSSTLSFGALVENIRRIATGFERLAVKHGSTVIIFAGNSPAWIRCALAAVYSGLVVVPVDPQHSAEVLRHIVDDSRACLIFTDENGIQKLAQAKIKAEARKSTQAN